MTELKMPDEWLKIMGGWIKEPLGWKRKRGSYEENFSKPITEEEMKIKLKNSKLW